MNIYQNYHCHKYLSNIFTPDSPSSLEEYVKRIKELGHKVLSSVEHGFQGNYFYAYKLAKENDLKFIFGTEAYWVKDRLREYPEIDEETGEYKVDKKTKEIKKYKDKTNCHMIILAKSENGRKAINKILSTANEDGYYYKPRLDLSLIFSLPQDDVFITTACIAGWLYEDMDDIVVKLHNYFKDNFMLEVQYHHTQSQKDLNKRILELSKKHNINIIAGMDSHFNYEEDSKRRDDILEYKKIKYENEEGWFLDYPDYDTAFNRFLKQGILSEEEIKIALANTNLILDFDDYDNEYVFSTDIKLPTIYPALTQEEKNNKLKTILNEEWKKYKKDENIDSKEVSNYIKGIQEEFNEIEKTNMADYFLFNYEMIKLGKQKGGLITKRGRGCFTEDALVVTKETLKPINEVNIGDYVITEDGKFNKVINTFNYKINESLLEFEYARQGSSYKKYKNICTLDHKVLVNRNNNISYIEAKNLQSGDLLCCPKIKMNNQKKPNIIVDLVKYNFNNFKYDDKFIYEEFPTGIEYKYSPKWLDRNNICNHNWAKKFAGSTYIVGSRGKKSEDSFFQNTPFKTRKDYQNYCKKHGFIRRKIPRYIELNELWNLFIGMMYGDGWTNKDTGIGFAINNTSKCGLNKYVFYKIANKLGLDVYVNKSKTKNLIQLTIYSKIINNWFKSDFFLSKKDKLKFFNENLFDQNIINLKWLCAGLTRTDGSINIKDNKNNFDNTSLSLINAYKILDNILGNEPSALDVRFAHIDKRGYFSKESYKVRRPLISKNKILNNCNYWFLPITKIKFHEKTETIVYDLHIENNHSYMINNIIVHNSAPSFFMNTLLGFSKVDRFKTPIKLYPERFLTADRILKSKSLPDIDFNLYDVDKFAEAQREIIGFHNAYPMIAYDTLQKSAAFKLYAGAKGINASLANEITKQLKKYEKALKYAEDDEKDDILLEDYVGKEYIPYIEASVDYQGIVVSKSQHPCAWVLLNKDIREEIGIVRCESKSTGKSVLVACIDGMMAEYFKFLKNDLLKVDVVGLTTKIWNRIGLAEPTNNQLEKMVQNNKATWDIYAKGFTMCINQVEKDKTKNKAMKYKISSTAELSAFVAAVRPAFASLLENFLNRNVYTNGVKELDEVLSDSFHYMLYQESIMAYLNWLGINNKETYDILKKIAKKKFKGDELIKLKSKLHENWIKNVGKEEGFEESWQVVEDASSYAFNCSHSYCVGNDGVEIAYTKAHYPFETYEVCLNEYDRKKNKDKLMLLKQEMLIGFGIEEGEYKFGLDNRQFTLDKENNCINPSLSSIKGIGLKVADKLYELGKDKYSSFIDILNVLKGNSINKNVLITLIKLDYFSDYGNPNQLLKVYEIYDTWYGRKSISKDKISEFNVDIEFLKNYGRETEKMILDLNSDAICKKLIEETKDIKTRIRDRIKYEYDVSGYCYSKYPEYKDYALILDIDINNSPKITMYKLDGEEVVYKTYKKKYNKNPIKAFDFIKINNIKSKPKQRYLGKDENGKGIFEPTDKNEYWIEDYKVLK